jgi:hypothetical protein
MQKTILTLICKLKKYAYSCCCFHAAKGLALYDSISIDDFKNAKKTGETKPQDDNHRYRYIFSKITRLFSLFEYQDK